MSSLFPLFLLCCTLQSNSGYCLSLNVSPSLSPWRPFAPVPLYARLFSPAPLLLCLGNSLAPSGISLEVSYFKKVFLGSQNGARQAYNPPVISTVVTLLGLSLLQSRGITRSIMVFVNYHSVARHQLGAQKEINHVFLVLGIKVFKFSWYWHKSF